MTDKTKKIATKAAVPAGAITDNFAWTNTMPCVATYKVLEGDQFLDQFEDATTPFEKAGTVKIGDLRFYPQITDNANIIELLADQIARKFLTFVQKTYTIKKHNPKEDSSDIIDAVATVFGKPDKTLLDLARVVSQEMDFPQAAPRGNT
jgi:hypothetical protein